MADSERSRVPERHAVDVRLRGLRDEQRLPGGRRSEGRGGGVRGRLLRVRRVVEFPQVFLQVEVPAESLAANVARERFLVVVRVHVKRQVVHLRGRRNDDRFFLGARRCSQFRITSTWGDRFFNGSLF